MTLTYDACVPSQIRFLLCVTSCLRNIDDRRAQAGLYYFFPPPALSVAFIQSPLTLSPHAVSEPKKSGHPADFRAGTPQWLHAGTSPRHFGAFKPTVFFALSVAFFQLRPLNKMTFRPISLTCSFCRRESSKSGAEPGFHIISASCDSAHASGEHPLSFSVNSPFKRPLPARTVCVPHFDEVKFYRTDPDPFLCLLLEKPPPASKAHSGTFLLPPTSLILKVSVPPIHVRRCEVFLIQFYALFPSF